MRPSLPRLRRFKRQLARHSSPSENDGGSSYTGRATASRASFGVMRCQVTALNKMNRRSFRARLDAALLENSLLIYQDMYYYFYHAHNQNHRFP